MKEGGAAHTPGPLWGDDHAPFQTERGDNFWPLNAGAFDTDTERRIADVYDESYVAVLREAPAMAALLRALACGSTATGSKGLHVCAFAYRDDHQEREALCTKVRALLARLDGTGT